MVPHYIALAADHSPCPASLRCPCPAGGGAHLRVVCPALLHTRGGASSWGVVCGPCHQGGVGVLLPGWIRAWMDVSVWMGPTPKSTEVTGIRPSQRPQNPQESWRFGLPAGPHNPWGCSVSPHGQWCGYLSIPSDLPRPPSLTGVVGFPVSKRGRWVFAAAKGDTACRYA